MEDVLGWQLRIHRLSHCKSEDGELLSGFAERDRAKNSDKHR